MAQLLVSARTGGVVNVQPDSHRWGRLESRAAWIEAGGLPDEWPGDYWVIRVPGCSWASMQEAVDRAIDLDLLPTLRQDLDRNGEATIQTWELDLILS